MQLPNGKYLIKHSDQEFFVTQVKTFGSFIQILPGEAKEKRAYCGLFTGGLIDHYKEVKDEVLLPEAATSITRVTSPPWWLKRSESWVNRRYKRQRLQKRLREDIFFRLKRFWKRLWR